VSFFSLFAYRFGVVCNHFIVLVTAKTGLESFEVIKGRSGTFCSFGLVVREGGRGEDPREAGKPGASYLTFVV
jgi:hypothetical protein